MVRRYISVLYYYIIIIPLGAKDPSSKNESLFFLFRVSLFHRCKLIARRIVDVKNVRAKHYWIDIRTNSTRCLTNTLLESSLQKTRSPIFPCPCSRASSSQVQLHLDNRFLGNSNSPLIRTKSESPGLTSYIYCKFNLENPKPRSQQCFVAPFLCISPVIPVTANDFMLCLFETQSPNALRTSIFRQVCVPYSAKSHRRKTYHINHINLC